MIVREFKVTFYIDEESEDVNKELLHKNLENLKNNLKSTIKEECDVPFTVEELNDIKT